MLMRYRDWMIGSIRWERVIIELCRVERMHLLSLFASFVTPQLIPTSYIPYRIVRLVFRISFYLLYVCYQAVRRLEHRVRKKLGWRRDSERLREEWRAKRDQDGDDEEDEDFTPSSDESDDSSSISEEEEGDEEEQFDEEVPSSILYTDLATSPSRNHHQLVSSSVASTSRNRLSSSPVFDEEEDHQADLSSIVLAHHTTTSASPLTRRRYHDLVRHHSASSGHGRSAVGTAFDEAISDRRREVVEANLADDGMARRQKERWEDGRQRLCLVCTMEERNIILWPCREFFTFLVTHSLLEATK